MPTPLTSPRSLALLTATSLLGLSSFAIGGGSASPSPGQASESPQQTPYTLTVRSNIVLTNVVARDKKTGVVVKDLKASDFVITEDKKPQRVSTFDFQTVDDAAALNTATSTTGGKATVAELLERSLAANAAQLRDHRLLILFFDLSSMQDEDIDRAVESATTYVNRNMAPADLVALVSLNTGLSMDQDFTADKALLLRGLQHYAGQDASGLANGATGSSDGTSDDTSAFTADDSEFNSLNTDRELFAIRAIAKSLERVDQKKSMLYFSGGITRNGIENQASLRSATNEAAKANLAIYSVDTRGLQALPPVGDASKGSLRGNSAYSGSAATAQLTANFSSQETLATLSADTGGKAFFDSNDFGPAFQQVQHDTEAYYILGFRSTNQATDGTFRHLTVTTTRKDIRLEYRPGYYAPADFTHQKTEDRELALTEQLRSDVPATDVSLYLQALYFRQTPAVPNTEFFVPISLIVPGSQIPFTTASNKDKANIDIVGQVKNAQGVPVGNIRDTVKLALDASQQVQRKNIQYSTGFTLAPGRYQLKFVVRENQTGAMGSFVTDLQVPDLKNQPVKLSSVVLASQRIPAAKSKDQNSTSPLVHDGQELVPNLAHTFQTSQHLYLLYEVYDPTRDKSLPTNLSSFRAAGGSASPSKNLSSFAKGGGSVSPSKNLSSFAKGGGSASPSSGKSSGAATPIHLLTSIEFLSNGTKVYETPVVAATTINEPTRNAVSFQFDVPLTDLKPGLYTVQVNVIDDAGAAFAFPRTALRLTAPPAGNPTP